MQPSMSSTPLALRQFTKDVPPGWRPRAYPIREYKEFLEVWSRLTRLDADQLGAAMVSRLEGGALRIAHGLTTSRYDPLDGVTKDYKGLAAISLPAQLAVYDQHTGAVIAPDYGSGIKSLLDKLLELYYLDDQDLAWTSLCKFFQFERRYDMDFGTYVIEWDRLFNDAEAHSGLSINDQGKCWLFWSRANMPDRVLADLRLKVNGDLSRFRDMIRLQLKISKNESASHDQQEGFKNHYGGDNYWSEEGYDYHDDYYYDEDYHDDSWDDYHYDEANDDDWYSPDWQTGWQDYDDQSHDTYDELYGGKGKGKGKDKSKSKGKSDDDGGSKGKGGGKQPSGSQCTACGSRWHSTETCPMKDAAKTNLNDDKTPTDDKGDHDEWYEDEEYDDYYGKGKSKGRRKGKRGKSKGFSGKGPRFPRSPFGGGYRDKGKGKGKGKRKGKPPWAQHYHALDDGDTYATFMTQQPTHENDADAGPSGFINDIDEGPPQRRAGVAHGMLFGGPPTQQPTTTLLDSLDNSYTSTTKRPTTDIDVGARPWRTDHAMNIGRTDVTDMLPLQVPLLRTKDLPAIAQTPQVSRTQTFDMSQDDHDDDHDRTRTTTPTPSTQLQGTTRLPEPMYIATTPQEYNDDLVSCDECFRASVGCCISCKRHCCLDHSINRGVHGRSCHNCLQRTFEDTSAIDLEDTTADDDSHIPTSRIHGIFLFGLSFSAFPNNLYKAFTAVKGLMLYGLLIDPGAARGLIGSDTLRDIFEYVLKPFRMLDRVRKRPSGNRFTGISPTPEHSLGLVKFPIGLKGIDKAFFECDVIGGMASKCPGLVPLQSLLKLGCVISCGYFNNGDGLLGIRQSRKNQFSAQRLLLTDSGHYLLEISHFSGKRDKGLDKLIAHDNKKLERSARNPPAKSSTETVFVSGFLAGDDDDHYDDDAISAQDDLHSFR